MSVFTISTVGSNDFAPETQIKRTITRFHVFDTEAKHRKTERNSGFYLVSKRGVSRALSSIKDVFKISVFGFFEDFGLWDVKQTFLKRLAKRYH